MLRTHNIRAIRAIRATSAINVAGTIQIRIRTRWLGSKITPTEDAEAAKVAARLRLNTSGIYHGRDENFKVSEIQYNSGRLSTINLPPTEIMKRTNLLPRDLVSLQLTSREERYSKNPLRPRRAPTAILPRRDCILLSFGNIRAVAGHKSVWVLDAHGKISKSFAKDLSAVFKTDQTGEAPELLFLETVLRDTVDTYNRRIRLFEPIVNEFLERVTNEVFNDSGVHQLEPLKGSLQSFELQVKQSLECLNSLLNDDDVMLSLLLSEQVSEGARGLGGTDKTLAVSSHHSTCQLHVPVGRSAQQGA